MGTVKKPVCQIRCIWTRRVEQKPNALCIGPVFSEGQQKVIVGHEDGVVRLYDLPSGLHSGSHDGKLQSCSSLETKGGPVQAMAIHNITRLHSANDLVVADSRGVLTVFSKGHILTRKAVSDCCIESLQVQKDAMGDIAIITGDQQGHVGAFSPYADLWKVRLSDVRHLKGINSALRVRSLLVADLTTCHGVTNSYILVADDAKHLYFIQKGTVVLMIDTPANVTAMCCGRFVDVDELESSSLSVGTGEVGTNPAFQTQVMLGCDTGAIYVMTNFEVYFDEYANVHLPVTQLQRLPASDAQVVDCLLCAGHFNSLSLLREGRELTKHTTPAWITSMVVADIHNDNVPEVVIGCHDNSIHGLKVQLS